MNLTSNSYLAPYLDVLIFGAGGLLFVLISLFASRIVRVNKPNPEKNSTYESGEEAAGSFWPQLNPGFYVLAIVFILFEVEIILMFLWAPVFVDKDLMNTTGRTWGWFSLVEVFIFVLILTLGLAYAWVNGYLDWLRPNPKKSDFKSVVPKSLYDKLNEQYGK